MGIEFAQGQFTVSGDRSQQIIEVMRDPAGEFSNRFHLLRLPQLIFFRLLAFDEADVLNGGRGEASRHTHGGRVLLPVTS